MRPSPFWLGTTSAGGRSQLRACVRISRSYRGPKRTSPNISSRFTGEALGSFDQSWTAAVALDWLAT
jgi:hypothetical protein